MPKMSHASKYHRHPVLVGSSDNFLIAHRAARLNDAANANLGGIVDPIAEWKSAPNWIAAEAAP